MKVNGEIEIQANPETVWYWLATPEKAMQWQSNISKTEMLNQTDNWVGSTFREVIEENGKGTEMEGVVTGYTKNELLSMYLSGKYNTVDVRWIIEPVATGTKLTYKAEVCFKSFMLVMSTILLPVFRNNITKQMNGELKELKRLCEKME